MNSTSQAGPQPSATAQVGAVFSGYCRAMLTASLIFGLGSLLVGWYFFGWPSIFLAPICALLYLIPFFGAPSAAVLVAVTTFIRNGGFTRAGFDQAWHSSLYAVGAMLVLNIILDYAITPRLAGGAVGVRPIVALLCTLAGGFFFGIWGLLLAIPVVGSLNILLASQKATSSRVIEIPPNDVA